MSTALNQPEREELERLRAELAALRAERPRVRGGRGRLRRLSAVVVVVVGCLLAPLSVVAVWLDRQVTDTDAYVQTVAPLIEDPRLQAAMARVITAEVFDALDVEGVTTGALSSIMDQTELPPLIEERAIGLAVPISNGAQDFLTDQVNQVVTSPEFAATWSEANRIVHGALVAALTGQTGQTLQVEGNTVSVNIAPFVELVKQRLVDRGVSAAADLPEVNKSFVLFEAENLARAQVAFNALDTVGMVAPFVVLLILAGGVLLAPQRRRAVVGAGLGLAASMFFLAVAIMVFRAAYLSGIPPEVLPRGAAAGVFDTLVRSLRTGLRAAFVLGLVVALVGYLTGASAPAVGLRRLIRSGIGKIRGAARSPGGLAGERVGGVLATYRGAIRVAVLLLAASVILLMDQLTAPGVIAVTLGAALLLLIIEVFTAPAATALPPAADAGDSVGSETGQVAVDAGGRVRTETEGPPTMPTGTAS